MAVTVQPYFTPALFEFFEELRVNNNRDWFQANKARYERDVRIPALRFIEAIGPRLRKLSSHLVADPRPQGGSLFRINRDTRFSADKTPYKTNTGMSFLHDQGRTRPAPGLYLHLQPGDSFVGGGIHMPDTGTLTQIRDAIVQNEAGWRKVVSDAKFQPLFVNMGESLKRAPQGYDPGHPFVEDLKRKHFTWHQRLDEHDVTSAGLIDGILEAGQAAQPLHRFLARAVGVPW